MDSQGLPLNDHYLDQAQHSSHRFGSIARPGSTYRLSSIEFEPRPTTDIQDFETPANESPNANRSRRWYNFGLPKSLSKRNKKRRTDGNEIGHSRGFRSMSESAFTKLGILRKKEGVARDDSNQPPEPAQEERAVRPQLISTQRDQSADENTLLWLHSLPETDTHAQLAAELSADPVEFERNSPVNFSASSEPNHLLGSSNGKSNVVPASQASRFGPNLESGSSQATVQVATGTHPQCGTLSRPANGPDITQDSQKKGLATTITHQDDFHERYYEFLALSRKGRHKLKDNTNDEVSDEHCKSQSPDSSSKSRIGQIGGSDSDGSIPKSSKGPDSANSHSINGAPFPTQVGKTNSSSSKSSPKSDDAWTDTKQIALEVVSRWENSGSYDLSEMNDNPEYIRRQGVTNSIDHAPANSARALSSALPARREPGVAGFNNFQRDVNLDGGVSNSLRSNLQALGQSVRAVEENSSPDRALQPQNRDEHQIRDVQTPESLPARRGSATKGKDPDPALL